MQRKTLLAITTALLIGLAGYFWWDRHQRKATEARPDGAEKGESAPAPATAARTPALGAAVIEGEVQFTSEAPAPGKLHREADPYCARREIRDPTVLVTNDRLANVWIHVIGGAPDAPPPPAPVEVHQQDCMYVPRVTTAVLGQKIVAHNDDPILHNVHAYLGSSTLFNKGMPNEKAAPIEYATSEAGLIKWRCDVHPWMRGYVAVSRNAFQAVTGSDGAFRIANLAPGRYTLEAWHEKFGVKTLEVTAPARVLFSYDGTER